MGKKQDDLVQKLTDLALKHYVDNEQKQSLAGEKLAGLANCDVCLAKVRDGAGYVLSTYEVVTVPGYWNVAFRGASVSVASMQPQQIRQMLKDQIIQQCSQATGWLVCDDCIPKFHLVNRAQAARYAKEYWNAAGEGSYSPPGGGTVSPKEALTAAARAWEKETSMIFPLTEKDFTDPPKNYPNSAPPVLYDQHGKPIPHQAGGMPQKHALHEALPHLTIKRWQDLFKKDDMIVRKELAALLELEGGPEGILEEFSASPVPDAEVVIPALMHAATGSPGGLSQFFSNTCMSAYRRGGAKFGTIVFQGIVANLESVGANDGEFVCESLGKLLRWGADPRKSIPSLEALLLLLNQEQVLQSHINSSLKLMAELKGRPLNKDEEFQVEAFAKIRIYSFSSAVMKLTEKAKKCAEGISINREKAKKTHAGARNPQPSPQQIPREKVKDIDNIAHEPSIGCGGCIIKVCYSFIFLVWVVAISMFLDVKAYDNAPTLYRLIMGVLAATILTAPFAGALWLVCRPRKKAAENKSKKDHDSVVNIQSDSPQSSAHKCQACGYVGELKKKLRVSIPVLLLFCMFYIFPGLIYALMRRGYKGVCSNCGATVCDRIL